MPTPKRVRAIRDRLRLVYGIPNSTPDGHPIAELIRTVLSQSTNDRNRDVADFGLRDRFEDWEAIRDAPVDQVEEAIRPGGISKVKSARIKAILRTITDTPCPRAGHRVGELSLDWLPRLSVPPAPKLPQQASPIGGIQHRGVDPLSLADEHLHLDPDDPSMRGNPVGGRVVGLATPVLGSRRPRGRSRRPIERPSPR